MKSNNSDKFEGRSLNINKQENFFLQEGFSDAEIYNFQVSEPSRRLNDYDSNILEEDAYKDVTDELFKLEYKMSKLEDNLKAIEHQIEAANEIGDSNLLEELISRQNILNIDYQNTFNKYNEKSLSAKITGRFSNVFLKKTKQKYNVNNLQISKILDNIFSKLPKSISSAFKLRKSLNTLETLNKSVDELISMNIPYGENYNKYEQLSKYIIKANSIQAEISKYIK